MLVKESNKDKINQMIKAAEGKARERRITYDDIVYGIRKIEDKLNIKNTEMIDIKASVDHHAQNFPRAYKYRPKSTQYKMKRKKSGWDLIAVYRNYTHRDGYTYQLALTDEAKAAIIDNMGCF